MANFYFCETCGNVFTSQTPATVNCCGKTWNPLPISPDPNDKHKLDIAVENGKRVFTMHHPQIDGHYFTFIAFVRNDSGRIKIQTYKPNEEVRFEIPEDKHGKIYWHCNLHGMYELDI